MTVGERVREVGLLRAAGATRAQVVRFVLAGPLVLGVAGSALGLVVGGALGWLMAGSVRRDGLIPAEVGRLDAGSVVIAFRVGIVRDARGRDRARPPGGPHLAGRGAPGSPGACPVLGARGCAGWPASSSRSPLAGLLVWPRGRRRGAGPRPRRLRAAPRRRCCSRRSCWRPSPGSSARPWRAFFRLEERLARGALGPGPEPDGADSRGAHGRAGDDRGHRQGRPDARARPPSAWLVEVIPGDELVTSIRPIALDEALEAELEAMPGSLGSARSRPSSWPSMASVSTPPRSSAPTCSSRRTAPVRRGRPRRAPSRGLDAGGAAVVPRRSPQRLGLELGGTLTLALGNDGSSSCGSRASPSGRCPGRPARRS